MNLSNRADGPDVVIEFDDAVHIDDIEPGKSSDLEGRPGWMVWARWRGGKLVAFAGPGQDVDALQVVKKNFWDACLMQYVGELREFAEGVKN